MYAHILKDSEASTKAWLSRTRAIQHTSGSYKTGKWVAVDGKPLGKVELKHLASVKVPPGWTNVHVSTDPNASLLAQGIDAKGDPQPKYSVKHTATAKVTKFARVAKLNLQIPAISKKSKKDMNDAKLSERQRDNAATLHLILRTGFRPGGSDSEAYGASTLLKDHVTVKGDTSLFSFVGKHKVQQNKTLKDRNMAEYLTGRLATMKEGDKVFKASGTSVLGYMKSIAGKEFKVKDLRTWNGTALARHLISQEAVPTNGAELKDQQKRISKVIASHLGNTPAVALESYIDPLLWRHTGGLNAKKA